MPGEESKLLPHLIDHITLAKEVESKFLTKCSNESDETEKKKNYFVYHFLHRTIAYGESIELLIERGFYHEAILVARTVLEGVINFEYYRDHHDIADKWRLFEVFEDGKKVANTFSLNAKRNWLYEKSERKFGKKQVDRAEKEFGFNYLPKETLRFSKQKLPELINKINDTEVRRQIRDQYDAIYNEFSQIAHWSPSGVIGGDVNVLAALTVPLDALFEMSREANKKYKLGLEKKIIKLKADASRTLSTLFQP